MFVQVVFQPLNASLLHVKTVFFQSFFHDCKYRDVTFHFRLYNGAERHVGSADKTGWLLAKWSKKEFQNKQLWQECFTWTANQCQTLAKISHTADYLINPQLRRNSCVWKQTCDDIKLPQTRTRNQRVLYSSSNRCSESAVHKACMLW